MSTLPKTYTFQRDKLLEEIRKKSNLRSMGIPITSNVPVHKNTTEIITVDTDPKISITPEPFAGARTTNSIVTVIKKLATINAPISYGFDELLNITDPQSKLPFDKRMIILGEYIAKYEEVHAFAMSSVGLRDNDCRPFIEHGTNLDAYGVAYTTNTGILIGETVTGGTSAATGTVLNVDKENATISIKVLTGTFTPAGETITGGTSAATMAVGAFASKLFSLVDGDAADIALAGVIGEMIKRYGSLKTRPLVLAFNAAAWAIAIGLKSTKTDKKFMTMARESLAENGGGGSGVILLDVLANTLTEKNDVMSYVNNPDPVMALMLMDENHFEIVSSGLKQRSDGLSEMTGLDINNIERWLPYVHDSYAIMYEEDVTET